MDRLLVDTDVLIDFTKGKNDILSVILTKQKSNKVTLFVNPVVVAEFLTDRSLKDRKRFQKALSFLTYFDVVSITKKVGVLAGEYLRKSVVPTLGDALIAASCVEGKFELVTRNKSHFKKVSGLKFYT